MRISDWSADVCSSDLFVADRGKEQEQLVEPGIRHLAGGKQDRGVERKAFRLAHFVGQLGESPQRQQQPGEQQRQRPAVAAQERCPDAGLFAQRLRGTFDGRLRPARRHGRSAARRNRRPARSEEHTSELQSLMRISYAVLCLQKKKEMNNKETTTQLY